MAKKVLMVVAFKGYRDEEYHQPKEIMEAAGLTVVTASSSSGTARGKLGAATKVDIELSKVKVSDFDGLAFIGGPGSYDYFEDKTALALAREAVANDKVVGGICAAAAILANAGVLKGIKATCFSGVADILKSKGALYSDSGFEVSGKLITADGPAHAREFGQAFIVQLAG
ncbi:MAG: DJ-1/PfpI family protein [Candidatus Saganbacteria bacterium]|nr:DJ-1/PfpI family protein [Candidatus Saganbacteria bacterium]